MPQQQFKILTNEQAQTFRLALPNGDRTEPCAYSEVAQVEYDDGETYECTMTADEIDLKPQVVQNADTGEEMPTVVEADVAGEDDELDAILDADASEEEEDEDEELDAEIDADENEGNDGEYSDEEEEEE